MDELLDGVDVLLVALGLKAEAREGFLKAMRSTLTADCDDIDPYAHHRPTPPRCDYALIYGSESR